MGDPLGCRRSWTGCRARQVRARSRTLGVALLLTLGLTMPRAAGAQPATQLPPEELARRQYESGLAFLRNGNYIEALKDFQAVVELHPATSVAPLAWLQIGRYFLEHVGDLERARAAADTVIKKYPTSDAVAGAHILAGRILIARSRAPSDLDAAVASFDRVPRLFPESDAVAEAFVRAGDVLRLLGRPDDALPRYQQVLLDFPDDPRAATAGFGAAMALAARGDAFAAMEQFQRVRNRWPSSPEAEAALARQTILYRLAVRAQKGAAFSPAGELPAAGRKIEVRALAVTRDGAVYGATDAGVTALKPAAAPAAPGARRPRGLTLDATGGLVVIEESALSGPGGRTVTFTVPRPGREPRTVEHIAAAVALPTGHWVVADADEGSLVRFRGSEYDGVFAPVRALRLAVGPAGEVAALERDTKNILIFGPDGKPIGRLAERGQGYTFKNPRDVAFDSFGHLYVLDQEAVFVFSSGRRLLHRFAPAERSREAFRSAAALAVDAAGRLYVADHDAGRVRVFQE